MKRQRVLYYDVLRVISCILVVLVHAPMKEGADGHSLFLVASSYLSGPSVPIFFMLSGALLLPCKSDRPVHDYVKKCVNRLIIPLVFFTIIYMVINHSDMPGGIDLLFKIMSIPFCTQGEGTLWFLYALMGLYLLVPIISAWLQHTSKQAVEGYLLLWVITNLYPFLSLILNLRTDTGGVLYYFTGYVGYFLLGYYLREYNISLKFLIPTSIAMASLLVFNKAFGWNLDFYNCFWFGSFPMAVTSATYFMIAKTLLINRVLPAKVTQAIIFVSNLSLGVYLVHTIIMRTYLWKCSFIVGISNYCVRTFVITGLTFIISLILCWGISYLPYSQYIIGYRRQK